MNHRRLAIPVCMAVCLIMAVLPVGLVAQTYNPTDDAYIDQHYPSANNGSLQSMSVRNNDGHITDDWELSSLVLFDISSLPSGGTVNSATLYLYYYGYMDGNPSGRSLKCFRITSTWNEATVTWNTRPSWASTMTSQATVPGSYAWMSWDVTADVQDFVDGVETNYGWIVRDTTPYGGPGIPCANFRTKEYGSYVPYLEVDLGYAVHTVCPYGSPDFTTIQAAVNAAARGDTIELCDTTFTGAGNRDIDCLGKAVYIRSASGNPRRCIIDCGGSAATPHRGFYFHSGEDSTTVVEGITITNGYGSSLIPGGPPTDAGGAVLIEDYSSPTFINCIFLENQSVIGWGSFGGGVCCEYGCAPRFIDCRYEGNTAFDDGGGLADFGTCLLQSCVFDSNHTLQGHGGGMTSMGNGSVLHACLFQNNWAAILDGGAISAFGCPGSLDSCIFWNNWAPGIGGGMLLGNYCYFTLEYCTFYENAATAGGGVALIWDSHADIDNTIISFSSVGEAVYCDTSASATLNCCDVYGNAGGDWVGCIATQAPPAQGNIWADPLFCNADSGDFHLDPASPCAPANSPPGCGLIGALDVDSQSEVSVSYDTPVRFALSQNIPNPFSAVSEIRYALPVGCEVKLVVYDVTGRAIQTLFHGYQDAGHRTVRWDGRNQRGKQVSDGVYFYRLEAGSFSETRRMVLMR